MSQLGDMRHRAANQRRSASKAPQRRKRGFTLVEVIVAVVVIHVGLLSLVAGSAVLIRRTTQVRAEVAALQTASNRLEALGAGSCVALAGSSVTSPSLREDWTAELRPTGLRELRDSVTYTMRGRARSVVVRTRLPC